MKSKKIVKMNLKRETVRLLTEDPVEQDKLQNVKGGRPTTSCEFISQCCEP